MIRFSFRQLELFVATARSENISAAAARIGLSQSAASTALRELERRSGTPLFDRIGKRLSLNESGRSLLPRAIELLDRAGEIELLLAGGGEAAALRLGATITIGNYLAPALIDAYARANPATTIGLHVGNTAEIAERLAAFDLDIALIEGECANPALEVRDWRADDLALFVAPGHPLAGATASIDRLLDERWVVREHGSGTRQTIDRAMAGHSARWRIAIEMEHVEAIKRFVALGGTIGCIARLALADEFRAGRLAEVNAPELDLNRRLYIVRNRDKYLTPAIGRFIALCLQAP